MSQQNEKDYFAQQIKVLNWLLQYRAGHHEWFTFHLSTAQASQFPFPGRGKRAIPNNYFYLDLISAAGVKSRYHLRLHVDLNTTYNSIVAVKLNLGVGGGATVPQDPVLLGVAGDIGFQLNGKANADCVIIENPDNDERVRDEICRLIDNLGTHVYQLQNGGLRERVVSNQSFENELTRCRDQLVQKLLAICNPAGLMQLNDQAVFQIPQGGQNGAANPDGDAEEEDDDENQGEEGNCMRNKIVFGAPGTGKSHSLKAAYDGDDAPFRGRYERVTFYSTYSYSQFVGSYKPVMRQDAQHPGEEKIAYQFVPGPFLRMLVKAANDPDQNYLLIIEEINRANAAAVFGDVFQLLDRTEAGESEYPIGASEDVVRYLNGVENGNPVLSLQGKKFLGMVKKVQEGIDDDDLAPENWTSTGECKLKLPKNLYIWATMNSADQGVFPLDTAFKRRWSFQYIGIDEGENSPAALNRPIRDYAWKKLRKFLNRLLVLNGVNEDKLMGPFFLKDEAEFDSKVLMYLWEDAARMCRRAVFGQIKTYSELCAAWAKDGIKIFDEAKFDDDELTNLRNSLNGQTEHA